MTFGYAEIEPVITVYHHLSKAIYIWPPAQMPGMLCKLNGLHFTRPCHRGIATSAKRGSYFSVVTVLGGYADPVPEGGRNKHVNLLFCDTFRALPEQLQMSVLGIKPVNEMSFSSQLSHLLGGKWNTQWKLMCLSEIKMNTQS